MDLEQVFRRALGWLDLRAPFFSIKDHRDSDRLLELLKPISELALTASLSLTSSDAELRQWAERSIKFAWQELEEGLIIEEVLKARPDLIVLISIYAEFWKNGFSRPSLDSQVRLLASTPGYFNVDLPSWRRLDLLYGLHRLELVSIQYMNECYERTWLAGLHAPWTITDGTAYGLTHTVFYMTDFGKTPDRLSIDARKYLIANLEKWILIYIREGNFDLAAELGICKYCIGSEIRDNSILQEFCQGQIDTGAMVAPKYAAVGLLHDEIDSERRDFFKHYHTNLVSIIFSAFALGNLVKNEGDKNAF